MKSSTIAILGLIALHAVPKIFDIECPRCRSWCSLSEVKRAETGTCNMATKRRRNGMDIPVVRTYYEVTYLCKRCGETIVRQEYRDIKLTLTNERGKIMEYDFLMPDEQIIMEGAANKRQAGGIASKGGHLYLTNKRLIFKAHAFNLGSAFDEIPFFKIEFTGNTLNLLMPTPNMIRVITTDGKNHGFIVTGKQKEQWKQKISEVVQKYKNNCEPTISTPQNKNEAPNTTAYSNITGQETKPNVNKTEYQQPPQNSTTQNPTTVSNTIVWIIALIPIIGAFFAFGSIAVLVANIVLCSVDDSMLKKSGYDTTSLGNTWLIPVYLYKRAEMFHHSKTYFIVWCITFVISCF